jgi:hypothetical protein
MILDFLTIWVMFVVSKLRAGYIDLSNKENRIIQKHMNK